MIRDGHVEVSKAAGEVRPIREDFFFARDSIRCRFANHTIGRFPIERLEALKPGGQEWQIHRVVQCMPYTAMRCPLLTVVGVAPIIGVSEQNTIAVDRCIRRLRR